MSHLLREIQQLDKDAASVLKRAGLGTDSDIKSLTREDLHELFPGCEKLKLRRAIFEKAQKHKPTDVLLRELKSFIPDEYLRAAVTGNGFLADYLNILKDMKTQMNNIQSFLDAHIDLLQGFNRDHPVQEPDTDTDAVGTSGQIGHNTGPADGRAQGHTNTDAVGTSGQIGHNTSPADGRAQGHTSKGTSSGEMVLYTGSTSGYQDKSQNTDTVGTSGQIGHNTGPADGRAQGHTNTDAVGTSGQFGHNTGPADGRAQGHTSKGTSSCKMVLYTGSTSGYQDKSQRAGSLKQKDLLQVKYKKVVTGKTFKADEQLMGMVMANFNDRVQFIESEDDAHTIIVFCPITSRIGSDVDAAMSNVRDDKPVILVLMHHTHEVKCTTSLRTWENKYTQAVLHVNVFYHETVPGLLRCKENNLTVPDIQRRLWENSIKHAGKNALDLDSYLKGGTSDGSNKKWWQFYQS